MIDFEEDEYGNWHLQTDLPIVGIVVIESNDPIEKEINPNWRTTNDESNVKKISFDK